MLGDDAACARDCDAALQQELVVGDDDEASWELDDAVRLRCARARCRLGEFGEASKRFSEVLVGGAAARGSASSAAIAALEDAEAGLRKSRASALDLGKARREFEAGDRAASRRDEEANARRLRDTGEDDDDHVVAESSSSQTTTTTPPETRYRRAAVLACGLLRSVAPGCAEAFRVAVLALAELRDWDAAREVAFRDDASPLLERALAAFGGVGPASLDRRLALAVLRSLAYGEAIRVSRDAPEDDEANGIKGTLNRSAEDTRPEQLPTIELLATVAWPRRFPRSRAWLLEDATRKTSAAGSCILALVEASRLKREGDAASRAGDPLRAAASYRAALQHDERDPVARSSLAAALQASALYEDAAREAAQALLEKPLHRRARLLRARCLGALFAEKATSVRGAPVALVDDALAEYERYLADCPRGHVPEGPAARTEMDALREQKRRLLDEAAAAAAAARETPSSRRRDAHSAGSAGDHCSSASRDPAGLFGLGGDDDRELYERYVEYCRHFERTRPQTSSSSGPSSEPRRGDDDDPYAVLGLRPAGLTLAALKRQYRTLVLRHHPDKCTSADAEDRFRAVHAAYRLLLARLSSEGSSSSESASS